MTMLSCMEVPAAMTPKMKAALDEATANIDTETEVLIQDSLEKMKNIGTMLIVAHRLSTIQHATTSSSTARWQLNTAMSCA